MPCCMANGSVSEKMRLLLWLTKTAVTAIVTSLICIAATFYTVNTYVNLLLDQYHIQRPANAGISWSQFVAYMGKQWGGASGTKASLPGGGDVPAAAAPQKIGEGIADGRTSTGSGSSAPSEPTGGTDTTDTPGQGTGSDRKPPEDAVAVWSQQSSGSAAAAEDQKIVMTGEEFTKKKNELTREQKDKVLSVISSMPASDILAISTMMEDGITAAEMREIEQLLKKHLKAEDYEELLSIIESE